MPVEDGNPLDTASELMETGRPQEAAGLLRTLIDQNRGGLMARLFLARAQMASGDTQAALETARETSSLHPGIAAAALGLGEALLAAQILPTAIAEFHRALRIDPSLEDARLNLAQAWLEAGESEKAMEALDAIEEHPLRATLVERAQVMRMQQRSDAGYVRHLFDQFSSDYDARMRGQLAYAAPEILRGLAELIGLQFTQHEILDLGCGTGLGGMAFKDLATRLDGIDLSPAMIEKARTREIYDDLKVADLETALTETTAPYDLLIAADTLVYLGDLAPVFKAATHALKQGGTFLFTVEKAEAGFELGPKRRWRHSETYLRDCAAEYGYEIAGLLAASPRTEAGQPVEGFAVALRKHS
ncbi:MAG TPA: tetratricopeptide repeat protein [Rhizomicrobium sp.]